MTTAASTPLRGVEIWEVGMLVVVWLLVKVGVVA